MIDDIILMILQEAGRRPGKDRVTSIYTVMMEIDVEIIKIIVTARDIERRNKSNENKE
ncbi:MAG: hypothetical protein JRI34_02700 [Deltaproteobacteria bacterium]|nr:hypothetical protein [Deltaproteobacteria bacterium]